MRSTWRSKEERREIIEAYRASKLSIGEFAGRRGISISTLRSWIRRHDDEPPLALQEENEPPRFFEVRMPQSNCGGANVATTVIIGDARVEFREYPPVEYVTALILGLCQDPS